MSNIAADSVYEVSYRSTWAASPELVGHLVVRRLDDHAVILEFPAADEEQAAALSVRAEREVRGTADTFEASWGIAQEDAAGPGPDLIVRAEHTRVPEGTATSAPVSDAPAAERDPGERVMKLDQRITVYPPSDAVFVPEQQELAELLHPLVRIDLAAIDPTWRGAVHLLSPVEPEDGLLGEERRDAASDTAGVNWLSFHVDEMGRYRFLGDRRLFQREDQPDTDTAEEIRLLYAEADAQFSAGKTRWERLSALVWGDREDPTRQRDGWGTDIALIEQLGGDPGAGNWTAIAPPPAYRLLVSDSGLAEVTLADGRPFRFVASTAGYPWRETGADAILLFFEPETRTAVLTFDWG